MPRFPLPVFVALGVTLYGGALLSNNAYAQNQPPVTVGARGVLGQIANVTDANLATLPDLLGRRAGISLDVSAAALDAAPEARDALMDWVSSGGIVFVHNDAARLFGYVTVEARPGNNQQAGQLYGRAKRALPFGAHPLLQGNKAMTASPDPTRLPGVNVVFYQMKEGDHLVVSHPAGTPILEVTDLTATLPQPLYASAIAPYGRGFAVFTPDFIDQTRADGATFAANLLALLPSPVPVSANNPAAIPPPDAGAPKYVSISQAAIDGGAPALSAELGRGLSLKSDESPALPPIGAELPPAAAQNAVGAGPITAVQEVAPLAPVGAPPYPQAPVLMLTRSEALGVQAALRNNAGLALAVLRTRAALARDDIPGANTQLAGLIQSAPDAAETAYLNGLLNATLAGDVKAPSPTRSQAALTAAGEFTRSASARPIIPVALRPTANDVGDGSPAQLNLYASELDRLGRLYSFDPPLVTSIDRNGEAIVIRYGPGDINPRIILDSAQLISSSRVLGWRTDGQEILLFPTEQALFAYKIASGQRGQNVPAPAAIAGDVVGSRVLMVTVPNGLGTLALAFLARLQTYALLTSWFDGGGKTPAWLNIGLENMVAEIMNAQLLTFTKPQRLEQFARVGGLLTPVQFEAQRANPSDLAAIQGTAINEYFYTRFGKGAVTETIQRLASGEDIETALSETAGLNETQLFQAWRDAQFGPRAFPNLG